MAQFRITYTDNRADEMVEAERVTVEGSNGMIVLRKTVTVAGQPRKVVVRRIAGAGLQAVDEVAGPKAPVTEPAKPWMVPAFTGRSRL